MQCEWPHIMIKQWPAPPSNRTRVARFTVKRSTDSATKTTCMQRHVAIHVCIINTCWWIWQNDKKCLHFITVVRSKSFWFVLKNHLTATYPHIRVENSPTSCTSIHRGFCKMLWYCGILFYFESVRPIENQRKNNNIYTGLNVFFKVLNIRFWQVS